MARHPSLKQLDDPPPGPPPWIPLAWLGMAIVWLLASAAGLVLVAPDLAAGNLYSPRVFSVTHGFTLGVVVSAILGALHQFIPVVLGAPLRHPRAAIAGFWLSQLGTLILVASLWMWRPAFQAIAWFILFLAVGATSWTVLPARRQATQNKHVGGLVSLGHSALGVAMLIALVRVGQGLDWWEVPRNGLLVSHLHLGLVGFGSMTALGIGSRMLPAFLHSSAPVPQARFTVIALLTSAGLLLLSIGAMTPIPFLITVGGLLILLGTALHLAVLSTYWRSRAVERLDPALGFIGMAIIWYGLAAALGVWLLWRRPAGGTVWAAYAWTGIAGWLVHLIVGVLHRIGPRLMANLRAGRGRPLPPWLARGALRRPGLSWAALGLLGAGTGGLTVGLLLGHAGIGVVSGWTVLAGALMIAAAAVTIAD